MLATFRHLEQWTLSVYSGQVGNFNGYAPIKNLRVECDELNLVLTSWMTG